MSQLDNAMTFEEVGEILRILDTVPRGGELTVELGGASLTVKLHGETAPVATTPTAPVVVLPSAPAGPPSPATEPVPAAPAPAPAAAATTPPPSPAATVDHSGWIEVKSPMTGIWYRSPNPGEPPFVEPGDAVGEGQQVGIIEVMKLMNRIVAPCAGTVREICATNEQLAEFGSTLVWIEPAAQ